MVTQTVALLRKELTKTTATTAPVLSASEPGDHAASTEPTAVQHKARRNRYTYQEGETAEEFFVPAIWTAAVSSALTFWSSVVCVVCVVCGALLSEKKQAFSGSASTVV
jgi:hypothetical protein